MDENKQIEEMEIFAQGIKYSVQDEEDKRYRYLTQLDKQSAKEISEKFYTAGYRKQSDTVREFVSKIDEEIQRRTIVNDYAPDFDEMQDIIYQTAKEYGVEVEE